VPFFIILLSVIIADRAKEDGKRGNALKPITLAIIALGLNFYSINNGDMSKSRLHSRTLAFLSRWNFADRLQWYTHPPVWLASEAGRWLNTNIPPDARLAADQMGQLGYYAGHHIIDTLGLMDEEIAHNGYNTELLLARNPDYVVWYGINSEPILPQFKHTTRDDRFQKKYTLTHILRARNELDKTEYLVFSRNNKVHEQEPLPIIIRLGLTKDEFISKWQI
jgi:hypothetical protein